MVPNLTVEVISDSNRMREVLEKVRDYFRAGIEQVWVIDPATRVIYVHESLTRVHGLDWTEELDAGPVLPGFRLKVADIFEDATRADR